MIKLLKGIGILCCIVFIYSCAEPDVKSVEEKMIENFRHQKSGLIIIASFHSIKSKEFGGKVSTFVFSSAYNVHFFEYSNGMKNFNREISDEASLLAKYYKSAESSFAYGIDGKAMIQYNKSNSSQYHYYYLYSRDEEDISKYDGWLVSIAKNWYVYRRKLK
jgi:hypothetical protein